MGVSSGFVFCFFCLVGWFVWFGFFLGGVVFWFLLLLFGWFVVFVLFFFCAEITLKTKIPPRQDEKLNSVLNSCRL